MLNYFQAQVIQGEYVSDTHLHGAMAEAAVNRGELLLHCGDPKQSLNGSLLDPKLQSEIAYCEAEILNEKYDLELYGDEPDRYKNILLHSYFFNSSIVYLTYKNRLGELCSGLFTSSTDIADAFVIDHLFNNLKTVKRHIGKLDDSTRLDNLRKGCLDVIEFKAEPSGFISELKRIKVADIVTAVTLSNLTHYVDYIILNLGRADCTYKLTYRTNENVLKTIVTSLSPKVLWSVAKVDSVGYSNMYSKVKYGYSIDKILLPELKNMKAVAVPVLKIQSIKRL